MTRVSSNFLEFVRSLPNNPELIGSVLPWISLDFSTKEADPHPCGLGHFMAQRLFGEAGVPSALLRQWIASGRWSDMEGALREGWLDDVLGSLLSSSRPPEEVSELFVDLLNHLRPVLQKPSRPAGTDAVRSICRAAVDADAERSAVFLDRVAVPWLARMAGDVSAARKRIASCLMGDHVLDALPLLASMPPERWAEALSGAAASESGAGSEYVSIAIVEMGFSRTPEKFDEALFKLLSNQRNLDPSVLDDVERERLHDTLLRVQAALSDTSDSVADGLAVAPRSRAILEEMCLRRVVEEVSARSCGGLKCKAL